jgi:hypothetical protein
MRMFLAQFDAQEFLVSPDQVAFDSEQVSYNSFCSKAFENCIDESKVVEIG